MQAAHCALSVALKEFPKVPELAIAKQHLEKAVALSGEYHKIKYSIFWKNSPNKLKKKTSQQMHEIAFDCYSQMLELVNQINKYAAKKTAEKARPTMEWERLILDISLAFDWIEREHSREIKHKQLSLF
jgi:hypothetical protein